MLYACQDGYTSAQHSGRTSAKIQPFLCCDRQIVLYNLIGVRDSLWAINSSRRDAAILLWTTKYSSSLLAIVSNKGVNLHRN